MIKFLLSLGLILYSLSGFSATTWNVNSGQSQSTIQGVINGASAGDTFIFAAGTYPVSSGYTIKCGITYTGPVTAMGVAPTAIMNSSMGTSANIFNLHSTGSGGGYAIPCSTPTTIEYFYFQGSGGIWVEGSYTNLNVVHNIFGNYQGVNGNPGPGVTGVYYEGGEGSNTSQILSNALFQWNQFGDQNSCTQALQDSSSANGDGYAGGCAGMQTWGSLQNVSILNNIITHVGEGIHIQCPFSNNCEPPTGATVNGLTVQYNDFSNWQRAAWEHQPQAETNVNIQYNTWHDPSVNTVGFTWGASLACCWDGVTAPYLNVTSNTMIFNRVLSGSNGGYGYEAGGYQAHYDNDLSQASVAWANGIAWGCGPNASNSNNTITGKFSGYIVAEFNPGTGCPSGKPGTQPAQQTGNVTGSTNQSYASQAPTITLSGNTFTFTDPGFTSGSLPLSNTGIWYTTDGSNPSPANGTSTYIASGGTLTVSTVTTPKAVGMWGAINQVGNSGRYVPSGSGIISTYPSGMGWTPSSVVTGPTYNPGGTPTAATPTFSPVAGTYTMPQNITISTTTPAATIYYTRDGSTPTTSSFVYSSPVTINATTTVKAIAAAGGYLNSAVGSAVYTANVANTCPVAAGSTQSQIQGILTACPSGNTAAFAAGTYNIGSTVTLPCGVSMTGPVVPLALFTTGDGYKHWGYTPTATFNFTGGTNTWQFTFGPCTTPTSIKYLAFNGNTPNGGTSGGGGGGSLYINVGQSSGLTLFGNYFYGNQEDLSNSCCGGYLVNVSGSGTAQGNTLMSNMTVAWNRFGSNAGCSNVMNTFSYNGQNYNNNGGNCAGIGFTTSTSNLLVENNIFYYVEEGLKFLEPGPNGGQVGCSNPSANQYCHANLLVAYNDFSGIHRIGIEAQDTPNPVMNFLYNSWHDPTNPGYGSWVFSLPQYNGSGQSQTNIITNVMGSVMVENVAPPTLNGVSGTYVPPIEFWGTGSASYNLGQGNPLTCVVSWGYGNTPWTVANNTYQGNSSQGYACNEENQNTNPNPTFPGNTQTTTIAALTSVAPTLSPASSSFGSSLNWTVTNPGTNRDTNTGEWCTTDNSTPTPGTGTALYYTSGTGGTVTATTTVKCVGMWGAANQPASYALGFGYVPSGVVQATYTGGVPTTATPVLNPGTGTYTSAFQVTVTDATTGASMFCTQDGSTPTPSSAPYTGPINVSTSLIIQCIATSSGLANSGIGNATYTFATPPTLSGCYQGNTTPFTNTLTVGGACVQQILQCQYSSTGETLQCFPNPDKYGSIGTDWGSLQNGAIIQVGAIGTPTAGQVCGVAAGQDNAVAGVTQGVSGNTPVVCSQWTFTVSQPTNTVVTPVFSPATENFTGSISVSASTTTSGATLYCTQDGTTPTTSSPVYAGAFTVTSTKTIQCIGALSGYANSAVGSGTYTQTPTATPQFSPGSQSFTGTLNVSISDTTPSASIYYTTNGSTPTTGSTLYTGAIPLTSTTTIKAIAAASGYANSTVATGVYSSSSVPLTSCTIGTTPNTTTVTVGGATVQLGGLCFYASTGQTLPCSPGPDANGDVVTLWGTTDATKLAVGAIGSGSPGVASGVLGGTANATASVGATTCTQLPFTVNNPTVSGVAVSLQGGGSVVNVGSPTQACATISYNGSVTPTLVCNNGPDKYGTTVGSWTTSAPGTAAISTTGLITGIAAGTSNIGVSAGGQTSPAFPITINNNGGGTHFTLTGPQNIQGNVVIQ